MDPPSSCLLPLGQVGAIHFHRVEALDLPSTPVLPSTSFSGL